MKFGKLLWLKLTFMPAVLLPMSPLLTSRADAAPKIDKVEPEVSVPGTPIVISGSDLDNVKSVVVGGIEMPMQSNSSTQVVANMPNAKPGCCMSLPVLLRFKDGTTAHAPKPVSFPVGLMGVVGPLPYPPVGTFAVDTAWATRGWTLPPPAETSGGSAPGISSPAVGSGNLEIVTTNDDAPTFYILTQFQQSGQLASNNPSAPVYGDRGWFYATLSMCDPQSGTTPAKDQQCKDWDGNIGAWKQVSATKDEILAAPAGTEMTNGMLTVTTDEKIFDEKHLVRKLQFVLTVYESQSDSAGNGNIGALNRQAISTQELTVVRSPAAMAQFKVLPYTIMYQPPGDESSATVQMTRQYTTSYALNTESDSSQKSTTEDDDQIKASANLAYSGNGLSVGLSFSNSQGWDNSTEYGFGTTSTDKTTNTVLNSFSSTWTAEAIDTLVPGSGETCASETDCAKPIPSSDAYAAEPFWHDVFVLLIHPEFATWEQLADKQLTVMTAAVPVVGTIAVLDLAACTGDVEAIPGINQCALDYSDDTLVDKNGNKIVYKGSTKQVVLTKQEAANLLKLDPFFGHGQGAELNSARVIKLESTSYGARAGNAPVEKTDSVTNTTTNEKDTAATTEYDATVTSVEETNTSFGGSLAAFLGDALNSDDSTKQTGSNTTKFLYGDSSAVSSAKTTTATVMLNDSDNSFGKDTKFHGPLIQQPSVSVFLDRKFGGFMYQDSAAPGPGSAKVNLRPMIVAELQQKEHGIDRFTDVPKTLQGHDAIGVLARAHILPDPQPGAAAGTFSPAAPIARADFAVMLARAAKLSEDASASAFTDVPATDPRAKAIAAIVAKGYMAGATATTFAPDATLTRAVMDEALAKAFNTPSARGMPAAAPATVDRADAAKAVLAALANR